MYSLLKKNTWLLQDSRSSVVRVLTAKVGSLGFDSQWLPMHFFSQFVSLLMISCCEHEQAPYSRDKCYGFVHSRIIIIIRILVICTAKVITKEDNRRSCSRPI